MPGVAATISLTMASREILGAVLAGGESLRMGGDKPGAVLGGSTLRDRALDVMDGVFGDVVLSVASRGPQVSGRRTVIDRYQGLGPLGALEAVLNVAAGRSVFVLACDLPLVHKEIVQRIVSAAGAGPLATAVASIGVCGGRSQPLCGLYSAACLDVVRSHLDSGQLSMNGLIRAIEVTEVQLDDLGDDLLMNINRPEDLIRVRRLIDG